MTDKIETLLNLYREVGYESQLDTETSRNINNVDIFEEMLHKTYPDIKGVAAGHHIMVTRQEQRLPSEFASSDTLIFNHTIAKVVWGDSYKEILSRLAQEPEESRDKLFRELYSKI